APPVETAAFGICAAAALVWMALADGTPATGAWFAAAVGVLAAAALLVPPWLLVTSALGAIASAGVWRRGGRTERWSIASASAAARAIAPLALFSVSPPDVFARGRSVETVPACVAPAPSPGGVVDAAKTMTFWLGPFVLGLAALGAFVSVPAVGWRRGIAAAGLAGVCAVLAARSMAPAAAAAPMALLLWLLAASGLNEIRATLGRRPMLQVVAALVLMLVPALSAARRVEEVRDDEPRPQGHERQTLRQTTTLLNLVPREATFVEEDATVDVLLRAAVVGGRRRLKPVTVLPRDPDEIARALADHAIYAFPDA